MTASNLMLSALRRSRPLSTLSRLLANPNPNPNSNSLTSQPAIPSRNSLASFHFPSCQSFSTRTDDDSDFLASESPTASEPINFKLDTITEGVVNGSNVFEESIFPVGALLESCHDLTGLPWWIIIASSTLAMRMTLFPLLVLQMYKIKQISLCFPKLPPLLPPPLSGRSYWEQITIFRKERRAICCPPFSWFLAYLSVQCPCFLLWMTSIRRMSLNNHPGFDCGGTLWFQNLTEFPHGGLAFIFPLLIAGLHYVNVQLFLFCSFKQCYVLLSTEVSRPVSISSCSIFRTALVPLCATLILLDRGLIPYDHNFQPLKHVVFLVIHLLFNSLPLLKCNVLLKLSFDISSIQNTGGLLGLLSKYYKYYLIFLTLPMFFIGYCIPQGNKAEGIVHLERVASLEEPEDPKSKAHYFDGLLLLASALSREGRKAEAVKYLRLVVAYDPSRKDFLEECENDEDSFVGDLVSSRRGDY
ncbi:ALBINO3-like protein 2 [Populus alba x Populus x berolinensis]|nr:ALBINO3-like protein 2 [Populus alba x Populus x berolinensis]